MTANWPPAELMARVKQDVEMIEDLPLTVRQAVRRELLQQGWWVAHDQFGNWSYLPPEKSGRPLAHADGERCIRCATDEDIQAALEGRPHHPIRWQGSFRCPTAGD